MSNPSNPNVHRFASLFDGLKSAHGTGRGEWVKRPIAPQDWIDHLEGRGPGVGVGPLREDNTVMFAAIDLDEADFDAAREMQDYIPGTSFVESSRSGNAHVWVFFARPCPAWVAMGILKEATLAAGKKHVEVFPKNHDFARVALGNYINLPFHGSNRPIIVKDELSIPHDHEWMPGWSYLTLPMFLEAAEQGKNDPLNWERRAALMQISSPADRKRTQEFGSSPRLHICAQNVIEHADEIVAGHRSVVFFVLAKALANWADVDVQESLEIMQSVNDAAADSIPDSELRRILRNAYEKQYTSTGCDDPTFAPYAHPDCRIANPR